MTRTNPLLAALEGKQQERRDLEEVFEAWFGAHGAKINPLMTKADARAIFVDAFELGSNYALTKLVRMITKVTERQEDH